MKILLDTHVWIFAEEDPSRIGEQTRAILLDQGSKIFISTVSTLEIAQLHYRGRLSFKVPILTWVDKSIENLDLYSIPLDHQTSVSSYDTSIAMHADPADRILVATARQHGLKLLTADKKLLALDVVETIDMAL